MLRTQQGTLGIPCEEITFDYQLDCLDNTEKKPCYCGAANCSGFIGGKAKKIKAARKDDKKKKRKTPKISKTQQLRELADAHESECFKCKESGDLLMCDQKGCPKVFCLECIGEKTVPKGKWFCPVHYCDVEGCGKKAKIMCKSCPNSYCCEEHVAKSDEGDAPAVPDNSADFVCWECVHAIEQHAAA
eukprot:m.677061 g.677061  ORF g.677061 m.677061 type:complete len:188 (+) comp22793_c0_seq9:123-686(+)